jgi:S1-C subfamily serine protease
VSIWVPLGLGLEVSRSEDGLVYQDRQKRLILGFLALRAGIGDAYAAANAELARDGATVHYRVFKDGWYVISATSRGGLDQYQRFHQDGPYVTGFLLTWNNANGNVSGERIATLTSASLWSRMTGAPFVEPPYRQPQMVSRPEPPAVPATPPVAPSPAAPPPAASPAPSAAKEAERAQGGTGFFVTADGSLVTNAHVVEGCTAIRVRTGDGAAQDGRLVAKDAANDLALLKVATAPPAKGASLRAAVRLGEGVAAFGFPHANLLSTSGNFTLGNVTALSGLGDDVRFVQVSTPVQAGNSGGPLLDQSGNVVGVVTAKLNAIKVALASGDLPQNVNFALKASILGTFLEANRVVYDAGSVAPKALEPADIAERARAISAMVSCR